MSSFPSLLKQVHWIVYIYYIFELYIYICVCVYVCACICMCVHTYTHTYTCTCTRTCTYTDGNHIWIFQLNLICFNFNHPAVPAANCMAPLYVCVSLFPVLLCHYSDFTMSAMASQITGVSIIYSTVCSCADQRKHQSSASLAFVGGIHRWPVNSPHTGPVARKMFPFDDIIMALSLCGNVTHRVEHRISYRDDPMTLSQSSVCPSDKKQPRRIGVWKSQRSRKN